MVNKNIKYLIKFSVKDKEVAEKATQNIERSVNRLNKLQGVQRGQLERVDTQLEKNKRSWGRLTGAFLSIMFFGMQMQRMFGGLVKKVLDTTGILDLLSGAVTVMLLPIFELLGPMIMNVADWMLSLDDETKKVISVFIILGAVIGTLAATGGQIGLLLVGLSGIGIKFSGMAGLAKIAGAGIVAALTSPLGIILAIAGALALIFYWLNKISETKEDPSETLRKELEQTGQITPSEIPKQAAVSRRMEDLIKGGAIPGVGGDFSTTIGPTTVSTMNIYGQSESNLVQLPTFTVGNVEFTPSEYYRPS